MASRLRTVCPGRWPVGRARAARAAALQTIRDGLLSAETLAGLLPDDGVRLPPGALLALVDQAALHSPHQPCTSASPPCAPDRTGAAAPPLHQSDDGAVHQERTDAELVAELHRHGRR